MQVLVDSKADLEALDEVAMWAMQCGAASEKGAMWRVPCPRDD